ncbi:hypothetical protein ACVRZD_01610 [Streptococcus hongkongensis]|nr:hypothetical protein NC01_09095 [Streptococcus uberis]
MTITIKRQTGKYSSGPITIRLNKAYVADLANEKEVSLEVTDGSIISYNFFDYPQIVVSDYSIISFPFYNRPQLIVSDGDKLRLVTNLVSTYYKLVCFLAIILINGFNNHLISNQILTSFMILLVIISFFIPKYKFKRID